MLILVYLLLASFVGRADGSTPSQPTANRLIYLIQYVGTDYDRAVNDGYVVDQMEYGEVARLTKEALQEYQARQAKPDAISKSLADLQKLIQTRATGLEVWNASRDLVVQLTKELGATAVPATPPNIANGRRRYADDCASCHGPTGGGDGPSSADADPRPTAFRGAYIERLSPRQVYNAMSLGVSGTSMPSFSGAYTEQELWDVAFFVMTMRLKFDPRRPPVGVRFGLEELAASSNEELLGRIRQQYPRAEASWVDFFRLNFAAAEGILPLDGGVPNSPGLQSALQMQDAFAAVAEQTRPRVVGVSTYSSIPAVAAAATKGHTGTPTSGWANSSEDEKLFPGFRRLRSGSGFLADDQGYVVSCDHLVRDEKGSLAEFASVELHDQRRFVARIVGAEPTLDLAILQITDPTWSSNEPTATYGDSDRLQTGHWLIALGDPPGPEAVFAVGVVSAGAQRQCYQEQLSATLVQSSLIVPSGGLGGPIVDIFGRIVGLSVGLHQGAVASVVPTMQPTAILPINLVLNLQEALRLAESDRSPWIGVSVLEPNLLRQQLGINAGSVTFPEHGVYIDDVFDPSPATRAGVRKGDFLLALNGHLIGSVADFQKWLYVLGIDTKVDLQLQRDGKPLRLGLTIEARPPTATTR